VKKKTKICIYANAIEPPLSRIFTLAIYAPLQLHPFIPSKSLQEFADKDQTTRAKKKMTDQVHLREAEKRRSQTKDQGLAAEDRHQKAIHRAVLNAVVRHRNGTDTIQNPSFCRKD